MIYEIQSKNDLSAGACVVIRFPEEELDKKALYTIEADCPSFIVPFRHRSVDGQIECIYQLGDRSKLHYRFGRRSPGEYVEFWGSLLQPILDCGDWFLKPSSFVLEAENIYIGRDDKTVSYIYVPSRADCMGEDALRKMAQEIAERNPVGDLDMENRVLRAIMQGFRPGEFLRMLRETRPDIRVEPAPAAAPPVRVIKAPQAERRQPAVVSAPAPVPAPQAPAAAPAAPAPVSFPGNFESEDIVIDLDGKKAPKGKDRPHKKKKPDKPEKPKKEPGRGGLFGGRKDRSEVIAGAATPPPAPPAPAAGPIDPVPAYVPGDVRFNEPSQGDETTLDSTVGLRLVSSAPLPKLIEVNIEPRCAFTIGRFDVSVGVQQSSFEFDRKTMAVSRHHAAIERGQNGSYSIVDLSSKAGTYVDGVKLTPNIPHLLSRGSRVSFGTSGADYVWEE